MRWLAILALLAYAAVARAQDEVGDLLARVNGLCGSLGLASYTLNGTLSAAAQSQALWMVETGDIAHTHPDGSSPRSRAQAAGYESAWVSENIYGGTNANVDTAWNFWINSSIHYAGLTSPNYQDIGIGVAHGAWGSTFVLVFGNPGGAAALPQASSGGQAASQPPSFVVGLDAHGNIMHEVQPGDTLGDIALIYGYTWDEVPYMMELNGLANPRELEVGSILLVPPYEGTYTPTAGEDIAATPTAEPPSAEPASPTAPSALVDNASPVADLGIITATPAATLFPTASFTPVLSANAASATPNTALVAAAPTSDGPTVMAAGGTITQSAPSPWLTIALVVQVALLMVAGLEFILRRRR